jgi:hypothetical protein
MRNIEGRFRKRGHFRLTLPHQSGFCQPHRSAHLTPFACSPPSTSRSSPQLLMKQPPKLFGSSWQQRPPETRRGFSFFDGCPVPVIHQSELSPATSISASSLTRSRSQTTNSLRRRGSIVLILRTGADNVDAPTCTDRQTSSC